MGRWAINLNSKSTVLKRHSVSICQSTFLFELVWCSNPETGSETLCLGIYFTWQLECWLQTSEWHLFPEAAPCFSSSLSCTNFPLIAKRASSRMTPGSGSEFVRVRILVVWVFTISFPELSILLTQCRSAWRQVLKIFGLFTWRAMNVPHTVAASDLEHWVEMLSRVCTKICERI